MSSHTSTLNGQTQSPPRQPSLLALIAVSMLSPFATTVIVPAMPAIQANYGSDYGTVQLTLSFFLASIALAQSRATAMISKSGSFFMAKWASASSTVNIAAIKAAHSKMV